jgi:hypothetical protein
MRKISVLFLALAPACLFAVDGVVLINQSTVMAAGGFPYVIAAPGSYKLSGNLVSLVNQMAIQITANNVVLDLNGFNVQCTANRQSTCIGGTAVHNIAIRNGTVTENQSAAATSDVISLIALDFGGATGCDRITVEDVHVEVNGFSAGSVVLSIPLLIGPHSIIRHNILSGTGSSFSEPAISCPSLIEGNINRLVSPGTSGCVVVNNVGFL